MQLPVASSHAEAAGRIAHCSAQIELGFGWADIGSSSSTPELSVANTAAVAAVDSTALYPAVLK
jgi:hypothetical protein